MRRDHLRADRPDLLASCGLSMPGTRVAVLDDEGFVYIVDRRKDMIVTGGFNVFSRETEDVLSEDPSVAAVAVIGVPDERWGEAVKAIVVARPGASVDVAALTARVREPGVRPEVGGRGRQHPAHAGRQGRQEGPSRALLARRAAARGLSEIAAASGDSAHTDG